MRVLKCYNCFMKTLKFTVEIVMLEDDDEFTGSEDDIESCIENAIEGYVQTINVNAKYEGVILVDGITDCNEWYEKQEQKEASVNIAP